MCFICKKPIEAGAKTYRNERFDPSCSAAVRSHRRPLGGNTELLASDHDKFINDPDTWVEEIRPFTDGATRSSAVAKTRLAVQKFKEKVTFDEKLLFRDSFLLNKRKYKAVHQERDEHVRRRSLHGVG